MAKIFTYTVMLLAVMLMMNLAGLPTATGGIIDRLSADNPSNINSSSFYILVYVILATSLAGIAIGALAGARAESFIVGELCLLLFTTAITDILFVYNYFKGICPAGSGCEWAASVIILIALPLLAGYFIAIVEWWRGTDS